MHALVIGGTRFVGYSLVFRLIAGGHRVTTLNRGTTPDPFGDRIERLTGDRTTSDFERLLAGRTFDAVVDFAAYHRPDVATAAAVLGQGRAGHYVFISTGQVYLVREGCPRPAAESDYEGPVMPRPSDARDAREVGSWEYGIGKRDCEDELAAAWSTARFPATRIRIPVVNGERDDQRRLEGYLWRLLDGGPVILPDGGSHRVRHVYGGEVARAVLDLLGDSRTFGEAYNLCQAETPTLAELIALLADLLGARPSIAPVPAGQILAAGLDPVRVSPFSSRWQSMLDPAKAERELGFRHEPLPSYLGKIVASFLAHPPASPPDAYSSRQAEVELAAAALAR